MTARLATAATAAAGTPGRRRIWRSGAARLRRRRSAGRDALAFELECDRAWIRANREREDEPHDAHRRRGEPRNDERVELELLPGEQRPEHEWPERGTEQRAEQHVRDGPRLARLRVHVGNGCPREQHGAVHPADSEEAEDDERRRVHHASERGQHAAHRRRRRTRPTRTGTRPWRSMRRPAGKAASAPAVRKIAGPRPRTDSIPVTRTSVIVATAAASCSTPESVTRHSARSTVFRRICRGLVTSRA